MNTQTYVARRRDLGLFPREAPLEGMKVLEQSLASLREQVSVLERRNEELTAFAHTVAHDLKDPLAVIIATSDAIFRITDLTPEELHVYLKQVHSTAYKMNSMIDNLLLLSELQEAEAPMAPLDMGEIVSHIQSRLAYLIKERHARIIDPPSWPVAMGYAPWIEEVWANYISNAIKYGGRPPEVELGAARRPDGTLMFWIRDNGRGLSPEEQAKLFKPFSQAGPVHTPGHGLGLWITQRIVQKHGGTVGIETESGKGSLFYFTLPAR